MAGTRRRLLLPDETGVRVAFIDILLDDCYRLRPLAGRCTTVLDVGAHAGLFTLAARMAFPGARIHAYEPNAAMRRYLEHQAEIADATIHLEAVGREAGAVSLARHPDSVRTRTLPDAGGGVPQVAFATALERLGGRADLVKLDCEGAEWEILRDGVAWRSVGRLTMEYHIGEDQPARSHEDARAAVRALGFTVEGQERVAPTYGLLRARRGVA